MRLDDPDEPREVGIQEVTENLSPLRASLGELFSERGEAGDVGKEDDAQHSLLFLTDPDRVGLESSQDKVGNIRRQGLDGERHGVVIGVGTGPWASPAERGPVRLGPSRPQIQKDDRALSQVDRPPARSNSGSLGKGLASTPVKSIERGSQSSSKTESIRAKAKLPAGLLHSRNLAFVRKLSKHDAGDAELTVIAT